MNRTKILVLDIETTGFLPRSDKIVEIGIVLLDLETNTIETIFNEVIKEDGFEKNKKTKNAWIFKNSSLLYSSCLFAQNFSKYKSLLNLLFQHYYVTAYNKKFDFGFLKARGIKIPNEYPDPMKVATKVLKLPATQKMINAGYGEKFKTASVQEAYTFLFKGEKIEPHRAGEDAIMEAEIIKKLYELGEYKIKESDENGL